MDTKLDLRKFNIIGKSQVMKELAQHLLYAAPHWDTVLVTGERGTGKELLARALHLLGPTRGNQPVIVDCAALHPATAESALFGHERGAFTGATRRHIGFFETAQEGTVFLDEISALPLDIQGRLLRFLEQRTIVRVGSTEPITIRTRIIAASNRDLKQDVYAGRLLGDLYDRMNILRIEAPPLRERGRDAIHLYRHFMKMEKSDHLPEETERFLMSYHFPGNVRELKNLCRRLSVFHPQSEITSELIEQHIG